MNEFFTSLGLEFIEDFSKCFRMNKFICITSISICNIIESKNPDIFIADEAPYPTICRNIDSQL